MCVSLDERIICMALAVVWDLTVVLDVVIECVHHGGKGGSRHGSFVYTIRYLIMALNKIPHQHVRSVLLQCRIYLCSKILPAFEAKHKLT